jgi:hypothetical protein
MRIITRELIPNLELLQDQYDKPINYDLLTRKILSNKTPEDLKKNKTEINEILTILAQEYIICLQPDVKYLLWILVRLINCWYADPFLNENICQIQVLINLYRARGEKDFNKDIGVSPVIKIIPKYGRNISIQIVALMNYYFTPYEDSMGWNKSSPSYFKYKNKLLYYTNGNIDLKRYINKILINNNLLSKDDVLIKMDKEDINMIDFKA